MEHRLDRLEGKDTDSMQAGDQQKDVTTPQPKKEDATTAANSQK